MKKEYYEIRYSDPFFKGYFTKDKLLELIENKEQEGWEFMGDKKYLSRIYSISSFASYRYLKEKVLAVLERDIQSKMT